MFRHLASFPGTDDDALTYIGNNLGFVVHYALLGQWTAAAMNGLMSVQTVMAIMLARVPRLRWAYYALMPALALASLITWHGLPSALAAAASCCLPRRRSGQLTICSSALCLG